MPAQGDVARRARHSGIVTTAEWAAVPIHGSEDGCVPCDMVQFVNNRKQKLNGGKVYVHPPYEAGQSRDQRHFRMEVDESRLVTKCNARPVSYRRRCPSGTLPRADGQGWRKGIDGSTRTMKQGPPHQASDARRVDAEVIRQGIGDSLVPRISSGITALAA